MSPPSLSTKCKELIPVREQTYRVLKEKIINGDFQPNERLAEEALASLLGVSRTPVREALHKLELEGLICRKGARGFCVPENSTEEMEELFEIRAVLEGHALACLSQTASSSSIKSLNKIIAQAEQAMAHGHLELVFEYNTKFHDMLSGLIRTKRPRLYHMIEDMREYVLKYRQSSLANHDGAKRSITGHKKIVMALELQDPLLCEQVMRAHVHEARVDAYHCTNTTVRS